MRVKFICDHPVYAERNLQSGMYFSQLTLKTKATPGTNSARLARMPPIIVVQSANSPLAVPTLYQYSSEILLNQQNHSIAIRYRYEELETINVININKMA